MRERRATVRVRCLLPAQYHFPDDSVVSNGRITNLSVKGLGLLARPNGERGESLRMSFTLPGEEQPLSVSGIIRWAGQDTSRDGWRPLGIEFAELDDTTRFCLQSFVTEQIQQPSRVGRLARQAIRLRLGLPTVKGSWLLMGGLLVAGLCVWILALQRERASLSQSLAERTRIVSQLEARQQRFQQELGQAKAQALGALTQVDQLQDQTAQLEEQIRWLSQNLGELRQAYIRVRDEREQMRAQLVQLEQQRAVFAYRLQSIPELRKAMAQTVRTRRQHLREEHRRRLALLREAERRILQSGNRGYIIKEGQPTLTSARLSIRVYSPEPTDRPFP